MKIPIFPLNTVLFPGGPLPLRIFETRYIDMISRCLKADSPFGVLQIRDGQEAGPASTYEIGTLARIVDFYQGSDGLLGITAVGEDRFRLIDAERESDGLYVGAVEILPEEPPLALPAEHKDLARILEKILQDLGRLYEGVDWHLDDAVWVTYRFIEIFPIELNRKQSCLESSDTAERLAVVRELLDSVRQSGRS